MFEDRIFSALLFDMDGTVITSIVAAELAWGAWARGKGLDVEAFLPTIHGIRAVDTIRRLNLPGVDPEREADVVTRLEIDQVEGISAIAGARRFLSALPADRWAIVTSAPLALARRRLAVAGVALPAVMVTAEDVENGKPAPDGYLLAAERLGVEPRACLVFEDAPAGIAAAERSGASVMVVTATHTTPVQTRHPQISDYHGLSVIGSEAGLAVLRRGGDAPEEL